MSQKIHKCGLTTDELIESTAASFAMEGMIVTEEEKERERRVLNGEITHEEAISLIYKETKMFGQNKLSKTTQKKGV